MEKKDVKKQLRKESLVTIVIYIIYFLWWYISAYVLGDTDPSTYTYIFGLPMWFVVSCFGGFILISTLVFFSVKYLFKDINLNV